MTGFIPEASKQDAARCQSRTTGILSLPRELRDQIYAFVIFPYSPTKDRWGNIYQSQDRHLPALNGYTSCNEWAPPALSRVSRQLRSEVLDLWYSQANFIFQFRIPQTLDAARKALKYLEHITPTAVLKHFYINWRSLGVGWIEPFVGLAQVFGVYSRHIPPGPINFGTPYTDLRGSLPRTCELVQALVELGSRLDAPTLKDRVAIREQILGMLRVETGDAEGNAFRRRTRLNWEDKGSSRNQSTFRRATE